MGYRGEFPAAFNFAVPTRYLTGEIMATAATFGKDTQPLDVPVNSIFEPRIYERGLKR